MIEPAGGAYAPLGSLRKSCAQLGFHRVADLGGRLDGVACPRIEPDADALRGREAAVVAKHAVGRAEGAVANAEQPPADLDLAGPGS